MLRAINFIQAIGFLTSTKEGESAVSSPSLRSCLERSYLALLLRRPVVADCAFGSGGDPESGSDLRDRNPDQKERVVTSRWDVVDLAREACVTLLAEGHRWRIENCLRRRGGIAHQAAGDCSNRAGRATNRVPDDNEPLDVEGSGSGREVHSSTAPSGRPRKRSARNISDRAVKTLVSFGSGVIGGGDHTYDPFPFHDCTAVLGV